MKELEMVLARNEAKIIKERIFLMLRENGNPTRDYVQDLVPNVKSLLRRIEKVRL